jgi:hypothetical protein
MSIRVEIKSHGMKQMRQFMRQFRDDINRVNNRSIQRVGLRMEAEAAKHLANQDLGWAPLSPRYLARKEKAGQSDKILIKTSTYLQSITSTVERGRVFAGVNKEAREADGQLVADIARVLEFGSLKRGIPPRPLWSVVLAETADWLRRTNYFAAEVIKELTKKYGGGALAGAADATGEAVQPEVVLKAPPPLETGKRGGRYHISPSGRKIYHKR